MALQFDQLNNQLKTNDSTNANASLTLTPSGTGAVLLNGTGQNFVIYSQDYTQGSSWALPAVTISSGFTDPLGGSTAQLIAETSATSTHTVGTTPTLVVGNTYTWSTYLKAALRTFAFFGNSSHAISVNLSTGVATSAVGSPTNITSTNVGNGWYRVSFSVTLVSASLFIYSSTDGVFANRSYAGTTGSGIYAWGTQVELGSTANTYIPTTTTAVYGTPTLSFSGVAGLGLQSDGSLYVSPAGTGALQAQATTSSTVGGNARGANAVDWQIGRSNAAYVAAASYSNISGGQNNQVNQSYSNIAGGLYGTINNSFSNIGGGNNNTAGGQYCSIVGGYNHTAAGFFNFIGGGQTNSATSGTAVTTQSATMNGTTAVTLAATNANIKVGQYISGTSIAGFTYVAAISGTSLTLSQAASGSSTSTLSFYTPHGVVVGGGNNQATGSYSFIGGGGDAGTAANRNVASGDWSFVGGGTKNTASGAGSVVCGGGLFNTPNNASGAGSFIGGGYLNAATGFAASILGGNSNAANFNQCSILGGSNGSTKSIAGNTVIAGANPLNSSQGGSQTAILILGRQTTDATATILASDTSAAGTTNQVILPNNSAYYFRGEVVSGVTGGGDTKGWSIEGVIKRGANAASTALVGTPTVTSLYADAGATTWILAVTADTTNGGLALTFTGQAATTIRTVAQIRTTEMTF